MYEVAWSEFGKDGRLISKRREFKTVSARQKFVEKLRAKENFFMIIATR